MRHTGGVRTQQDRDEQTALIGAGLGVFALVLAAEVLGGWFVHTAFELDDDGRIRGAVAVLAIVFPVLATIVFLVRSERR